MGIRTYTQYLQHLWTIRDEDTGVRDFARGYEDFYSARYNRYKIILSPRLMKHLRRIRLNMSRYEEAIKLALLDLKERDTFQDVDVVVMVVGAGRGPLVKATIKASKESGEL